MMAPISSTNLFQNTYKDGKISQNAVGKVTNALGRFSRLPGAQEEGVRRQESEVRRKNVDDARSFPSSFSPISSC
jgi:hypothetical protein